MEQEKKSFFESTMEWLNNNSEVLVALVGIALAGDATGLTDVVPNVFSANKANDPDARIDWLDWYGPKEE